METEFKINWEKTCLVQNKMNCLEVDLGEKADFAGALLETLISDQPWCVRQLGET